MPVNIFIDTSIFLNFYTASKDDLDQLEKLIGLISEGHIKIYVTAQVEREWLRNRDNKLAEAIKIFEDQQFKLNSVPRFMLEYEEISQIRNSLEIAEKARLKALNKARTEAVSANTSADKLIQRIFYAAGVEPDDEAVILKAQRRLAIGDPPGKNNSLGDRINWEQLLASEILGEDMHIISRDGDYFSPLDERRPKHALLQEWFVSKKGKLSVHRQLKPFLSATFPQFKFKKNQSSNPGSGSNFENANQNKYAEAYLYAKKYQALTDLEESTTEPSINQAISEINKFLHTVNESELLSICRSAILNEAIQEHAHDDNIHFFFENIIPRVMHLMNRHEIKALEHIFDLELHPEEYELTEEDTIPNYGQMDLDLFEEEIARKSKLSYPREF